jgi:hypothetical protein
VSNSYGSNGTHVILEEIKYTVKSSQKARLSTSRKIIIHSQKDRQYAQVAVSGNQFRKVTSIKARVLNQRGKVIRKLRKSDIREIDASTPYALYTGDKYYTFDLSQAHVPYIIEYTVTSEISSLFFWPDWYPQDDIPIQSARYILSVPKEIDYQTTTVGPIPDPFSSANGTVLTWELNNVPASRKEDRMAPEDRVQYALHFAPAHFTLDGIEGTSNSWAELGAWYSRLAQNQYVLGPESATDLPELNGVSTRETIQLVYEYLQDRTRYVAIELGIHGWKPHSAQSVCDNRYGDCKDLATFLIALLAQHDIEAYPALLKTRGSGVVLRDFPSNQFNHAIAYIPLEDEALWVDCTSNSAVIDDLPAQDEGCSALVIRQGRGELLTTPTSRAEDNQLIFAAEATLHSEGSLTLKGMLTASGNVAQGIRDSFRSRDESDRRNLLIRWLSDYSPAVRLLNMRIVHLESNLSPLVIRFDCIAENYANVSRSRIFLNPSFYNRLSFDGEGPGQRQSAVFRPYAVTHLDSITYIIPENLAVEAVPESNTLTYPFACYDYQIDLTDNRVSFRRNYRILQRKIDLDQYADYYEFMEQVEQKDSDQLVFIKK